MPAARWRCQFSTRIALAVSRSCVSLVFFAQKDSRTRFNSRFDPMREKPRLCVCKWLVDMLNSRKFMDEDDDPFGGVQSGMPFSRRGGTGNLAPYTMPPPENERQISAVGRLATFSRIFSASAVERYRSVAEQPTVTMRLPLYSGRLASCNAAQTLAPVEIPAGRPSSRASACAEKRVVELGLHPNFGAEFLGEMIETNERSVANEGNHVFDNVHNVGLILVHVLFRESGRPALVMLLAEWSFVPRESYSRNRSPGRRSPPAGR